ncbi:MAG: RluA family pseudouridine synthase [Clostridia bacterium]|nr:RluA family pseudouridine synthase [Clostridia bacterium]
MNLIVDSNDNGIRIDKYLASKLEFSRVAIQRMIDNGKILVNGDIPKDSYKVNIGDEIVITPEEIKEATLEAENIPLDIVYEDDDIVVVNKAKGLVVHPGNGNPNGTLVNAIMSYCKDSLSGIGGEIRPGIVHRIDKDTSGLLIIAKNDIAHINISEQIKNHEVKKIYRALVRGRIKENSGTINMPISRSLSDRTKMAVNKNGKEAITHFKVLKKYKEYTYIEVNIETGRTHQIRVHMAQIGFPLVGDSTYSNGKNPFNVSGQMLHSYKLEFIHPRNGKKMELKADIPEYFKNVIDRLDEEENS